MLNTLSKEERIRDAFQLFDLDGDGQLNKNELKAAVRRLGLNVSDDEVEEMLIEADTDVSGCLSYKEFNNIIYETNTLRGTGVGNEHWEIIVNILYGDSGLTPRIEVKTPNSPVDGYDYGGIGGAANELDLDQYLRNLGHGAMMDVNPTPRDETHGEMEENFDLSETEQEAWMVNAPTLQVTGADEEDDMGVEYDAGEDAALSTVPVPEPAVEEEDTLEESEMENHIDEEPSKTDIHDEAPNTNDISPASIDNLPSTIIQSTIDITEPTQEKHHHSSTPKLPPLNTSPKTSRQSSLINIPTTAPTPASPLSRFADAESDEDIDVMLQQSSGASSARTLDFESSETPRDTSSQQSAAKSPPPTPPRKTPSPTPHSQEQRPTTSLLPMRRPIYTSSGAMPADALARRKMHLSKPKPRPSTSAGIHHPTLLPPKPAVPRFDFTVKSEEVPYYKRKEYIDSYLNRPSQSPEKTRPLTQPPEKPDEKVLEYREKTRQRVRKSMRRERELQKQQEEQEKQMRNNFQEFVSKVKRTRKRNRSSLNANGGGNLHNRQHRRERSPSPPSNNSTPIQYHRLSWQHIQKLSFPPPVAHHSLVNVQNRYIALVGSDSLRGNMYFYKDNRWFAISSKSAIGVITPRKGCSVIYHDALQALILHGTMSTGAQDESAAELQKLQRRHREFMIQINNMKRTQEHLLHSLETDEQAIEQSKQEISQLEMHLETSKPELNLLVQKKAPLQERIDSLADQYDQFCKKIDQRIEEKFYKDSEVIFQLESQLKKVELEEFAPIRERYEQLQHAIAAVGAQRDRIYETIMLLSRGHYLQPNGENDQDDDIMSAVMHNNTMSPEEKRIFLEKQLVVKDAQLDEFSDVLQEDGLADSYLAYQQKIKDLRRDIVISQSSLHSFTKVYEQQKEDKESELEQQRGILQQELDALEDAIQSCPATKLLSQIKVHTTLTEEASARINSAQHELEAIEMHIHQIEQSTRQERDRMQDLERRDQSSNGAVWMYMFQTGQWGRIDDEGGIVGETDSEDAQVGQSAAWDRTVHNDKQVVHTRFHSAALCKSSDTMLVFGGAHKKQATNALRIFSFARSEWQVISQEQDAHSGMSIPAPRYHHTAQVFNDTDMIIYGGTDGKRCYNDVWRYESQSQCWTQLDDEISGDAPPPCPGPISSTIRGHEMFIWSQKGLYILNLQQMRWEQPLIDETVSPRDAVGLCFFRGNIVMFGGRDASSGVPCNDMFELNLKRGARRVNSMKNLRVNVDLGRGDARRTPDYRFEAYRPNPNLYDLSLFKPQPHSAPHLSNGAGVSLPAFQHTWSGTGGMGDSFAPHSSSNPYGLPVFGRSRSRSHF